MQATSTSPALSHDSMEACPSERTQSEPLDGMENEDVNFPILANEIGKDSDCLCFKSCTEAKKFESGNVFKEKIGPLIDALSVQRVSKLYANFLLDFGASEPFLVDGDSLIAYCLEDRQLDWVHGGQFLHLVFLVEKLLRDLRERGAQFEMFFFLNNGRHFDAVDSTYRLGREVVMRHFLRQTNSPISCQTHLVSGEWSSPDEGDLDPAAIQQRYDLQSGDYVTTWKELLTKFNPAYLLSNNENVFSQPAIAQKCFVHDCLVRKVHVVLLDGLSFSGSQLAAFSLQPPLSKEYVDNAQNLLESVRRYVSKNSAATATTSGTRLQIPQEQGNAALEAKLSDHAKMTSAPDFSSSETASERVVVTDRCLSVTLSALQTLMTRVPAGSDFDHFLAAVLVIASVTKTHLPLKERSFALGEHQLTFQSSVTSFISRLHSAMVDSLEAENFGTSGKAKDHAGGLGVLDTRVADLFDGRLFHVVLLKVCALEEFPELLLSEASQLFAFTGSSYSLQQALKLDIGIVEKNQTESLRVFGIMKELTVQSAQHASREITLHPSTGTDGFMDAVLEKVQRRMIEHENNPQAPGAGRLQDRGYPCNPFRRDHHFHSIRPLTREPDCFESMEKFDPGRGRTQPAFSFRDREAQIRFEGRKKLRLLGREQKKARAAVVFTQGLLHGSPVTKQVICERLLSEELRNKKFIAEAAIHGQCSNRGSARAGKSSASETKQKSVSRVKSSQSGKAQKLIEENKKNKKEQSLSNALPKLANLKVDYRPQVSSAGNQEEALTRYLKKLQSWAASNSGGPDLFARLEMIDAVMEFCSSRNKLQKQVFILIQEILRDSREMLTTDHLSSLASISRQIGFHDLSTVILRMPEGKQAVQDAGAKAVQDAGAKAKQRKKTSTVASVAGSAKSTKSIAQLEPVSSILFQLSSVAENLSRPAGVAGGDKRVQFLPDEWQVRLLNIVDSENSALVIAPTASGKTFISYYIMELCLRASDDSVVVFVAPTKALVNQVKAEIDARFKKTYAGSGKYLSGVFTRDFRENIDTCQVLVTVPQCLQILLLGAEQAEWVSRIRSVILDEVHFLGMAGGYIWEQVILLVDAPLVALSATLGNVSAFAEWLESVERAKGRELHVVEHHERYNDLQPWLYCPTHSERLVEIHPFATMKDAAKQARITELPKDLKLLPEHSVRLCSAISRHLPAEKMKAIEMEAFFRHRNTNAEWNISMRDACAWELSLKEVFCGMGQSDQLSVVDEVSEETENAFKMQDNELGILGGRGFIRTHLICLLDDLSSRGMLPAICFHLSRGGCEFLTRAVLSELESRERKAREAEGWQSKLNKQLEQHKLLERELERCGFSRDDDDESMKKKSLQVRNEIEQLLGELRECEVALSILQQIDVRFTFSAEPNIPISESEIRAALRLSDEDEVPAEMEMIYEAMKRGIAPHHSGMNKRWRVAVEHLVRSKRLGVVFATSTLSMGINAPSKTSVLAGDAIYLNAMMYRQMAGRAGRRGHDKRGHTVFFAIPSPKVCRLLRAQLPSLQGDLVLSNSMMLRMVMRQSMLRERTKAAAEKRSGSKAAAGASPAEIEKRAARACARLVQHPLFKQNALMAEQASHCFRFSAEFLLQQGLLMYDDEGNLAANDLAALISHLYFMEPGNFAFVQLLTSGYISKLCKEGPSPPDLDSDSRVVRVLCHLFCNLPISRELQRIARDTPLAKLGNSSVILDDMCPEASSILASNALEAVKTLSNFLDCFIKSFAEDLGEDVKLPLTGELCGPFEPNSNAEGFAKDCQLSHCVRSSFVALSGWDDQFTSIADLCQTLRSGVHMDPKMVPAFEPGLIKPLNAYLLDFFRHGQTKALVAYNGIKKDDLWDVLQEFHFILRALWSAMERRAQTYRSANVPFADEEVLATFKRIGDRFAKHLFKYAA